MQTLVYQMSKLGQVAINTVILLGLSGPKMNCPGYEPDLSVPCATAATIRGRVDPELYARNPYGWCHELCPNATFDWDLSIPYVSWRCNGALCSGRKWPRRASMCLISLVASFFSRRRSQFCLCISFVIVSSIPLYLRLQEDKVEATPRLEFLRKFWTQVKRRACWQVSTRFLKDCLLASPELPSFSITCVAVKGDAVWDHFTPHIWDTER